MKPTVNNIIRLWFGADTPIKHYKIKLNPELWEICQRVSQEFTPPSGAQLKENYRKSDKTSFARAVLEELEQLHEHAEESYDLAH